ncbi:TetR family transcriptional regulator [Stackebrandtia endophytica]|uniref:TetR family transcriptional regulator n=1 Tax=Stackebrandtia endophytica TaxID=1496996 RepID=A0A543AV89_9ACTN|nr:TetR/AcrR family transcriptional regulator [Stackebrandtia endophytica]TQL76498.1 TetR family transcriptional regulator [Stackebrandtia endophytica]
MPTGVPIRDAKQQLFAAAERVLLRDGLNGLTSRAVTTEAGVAKGLMHRRFADFDAFLAELVLDRIARVEEQTRVLLASAGQGTVVEHLTDALVELFSPMAVSVLGLIIARPGLRNRLREAGTARIPLLGEGTEMIRAYLAAEQRQGRLPGEADVGTMAPMLTGAVHLLCTEQVATPDSAEVSKIVRAAVPIGSATGSNAA